jgi:uncharacterized protein
MASIQRETARFPGSGGRMLASLATYPERPSAWALLTHCFTCNKNYKAINYVSRALNEAGIGAFRFDFGGLGESAGDFADTNLSSNIADVFAAAEHMRATLAAPQLLIGHSLGAAAALLASRQIPSVRAVAIIGCSFQPQRLQRLFKGADPAALASANGLTVNVNGRPMRFRQQFLDDLDKHDLPGAVASLRVPLLIVHSRADQITPFENGERLFEAAAEPKAMLVLDAADHLLSRGADGEHVGREIAAWAAPYLQA